MTPAILAKSIAEHAAHSDGPGGRLTIGAAVVDR